MSSPGSRSEVQFWSLLIATGSHSWWLPLCDLWTSFSLTLSPCNVIHSQKTQTWVEGGFLHKVFAFVFRGWLMLLPTQGQYVYLFTYLLYCEVWNTRTHKNTACWIISKIQFNELSSGKCPWDSQLQQETVLPVPWEPLFLVHTLCLLP